MKDSLTSGIEEGLPRDGDSATAVEEGLTARLGGGGFVRTGKRHEEVAREGFRV
jgi:hypothetical protein